MSNAFWSDIHKIVEWLDTENGRGPSEIEHRLFKPVEEIGEVANAWIGWKGANPKKGLTHTLEDVLGELCDVMFSAGTALATLSDTPEAVFEAHLKKVVAKTVESPMAELVRARNEWPPGPQPAPAECACDGQTLLKIHTATDCYDTEPPFGERHGPTPEEIASERIVDATRLKREEDWVAAVWASGRSSDRNAIRACMAKADEEQQEFRDLVTHALRKANSSRRELIARLGEYADRGIANGQEAERLRTELEKVHSKWWARGEEIERLSAELEKARAIPSHIWQVWREDEPIYAVYATEGDAKQGSIDCWQEMEPNCPDYSWAKDGPRLELVVGGERGGVYLSRQPVYGRHLTAAGSGGQAEDGARPATAVDPDVVAYRSRFNRALRCLAHKPAAGERNAEFIPVTSEDLPDGGTCTYPIDFDRPCGVDVLISQKGGG